MSEAINAPKEEEQLKMNIEVVNDVPEEDVPYLKNNDIEKADNTTEDNDDLENYSDRVQKRIKKLKHDWHAERRGKEEAHMHFRYL